MIWQRCSLLLALACCPGFFSAPACEIRVRDSAFRSARDIHQLCLIAESSDEAAAMHLQRMNEWLETVTDSFNLRVVRIDADDPQTDWRALGIPSIPPTLPVTVLVGRDNGTGASFVIDHWEPAPNTAQLAEILDSPVRHRLPRELASNLAVLVYAPQHPGKSSDIAESLQSTVAAGIAGERIGLAMVTVDRQDPAERLLCRFIGLRPDSPDTVCLAFGRGKLMSPPLVGDEIDPERITELVSQIQQACSCSKPLQTMGVDLPLLWPESVDSTVVLMDAELTLSEIDRELQVMPGATSTASDGPTTTDPALLTIPPGREANAAPAPAVVAGRTFNGAVIALAVGSLAVVLGLARRAKAEHDRDSSSDPKP